MNEREHSGRAKQFWRAVNTDLAMSDAMKYLGELLELVQTGSFNDLLWVGYVVSYSRPFTGNEGIGHENKSRIVPSSFHSLHDEIVNTYRNKMVAHTDATNEDWNKLIITKTGGALEWRMDHKTIDLPSLWDCMDMTTAVSVNVQEYLADGLEVFDVIKGFEDGEYQFKYDTESGSEWEKKA